MKVLVASDLDGSSLSRLERDHSVITAIGASESELAGLAGDREVIVFRSGVEISSRVIGAAPDLKLLLRAGSGLDNLALETARERDIRVFRIPGPGARAVAELTFGLMLSLARPIGRADALIRQGHWPKRDLSGGLLVGKTLGVLGAGNIGTQVGELGVAWGMNVIACVEAWTPARAAELASMSIELTEMDRVLRESDFLAIHANLQASTRHLVAEAELAQMKPDAFLVNMARGGILDEAALGVALETGRIAGAALDVHEAEGEGTVPPLSALPNVILTPHIGAMAREAQAMIGERVIDLLGAFAAGRVDDAARPDEVV